VAVVRILFSLYGVDHAAGLDQCVKVIDDAVIEAVELRPLCVRGSGVGSDGAEEASGQRGVDAFEQLEENQAERVSMGGGADSGGNLEA
jgi:hypothetical protein